MAIDYTKRPKTQAPEPAPAPAPAAAPPAAEPPAAAAPSKIVLTKGAPSVSLTKRGGTSGSLRVNLNWDARAPQAAPARGGFFSRRPAEAPPVDLDLGCLYEFDDGSKGAVQALGGGFTSKERSSRTPIITLDGDDRSGTVTGGENLRIDLAQSARIRRVLVFAYIYEGVPNWAAANAVVTLFPTDGPTVEVRLDEHDPASPMCAIALLESVDGVLQVRREVRYVRGGQRALDDAYGWGMTWATGKK